MASDPAFSTPRTPGRHAALHEEVGVRSLSGSAFIFHANIFHAEIMLRYDSPSGEAVQGHVLTAAESSPFRGMMSAFAYVAVVMLPVPGTSPLLEYLLKEVLLEWRFGAFRSIFEHYS